MKTPFTNSLLAFMAGAAAGAALGILFAPDKGENTRQKIKEKMAGLGDKIDENLGEQIKNLRKDLNQFVENVSKTLDDIVEKANQSTDPKTNI